MKPTGKFVFINGASAPVKSSVFKLPSGSPIAFDIFITGTATVKIYASNIESSASGTKWGSPLKTITASSKLIIENEPWINWMVDFESGSGGSVDVVASI